jgi:hypothetical protein
MTSGAGFNMSFEGDKHLTVAGSIAVFLMAALATWVKSERIEFHSKIYRKPLQLGFLGSIAEQQPTPGWLYPVVWFWL